MSDRIDELLESKGLPANVEAERIILGTAQIHPESFDDLVRFGSVLQYEFSRENHRTLYGWHEQVRAKGMPLTLDTICDGRSEAEIERVGGKSYIAKLVDYAVSPDTVRFYAEKVREKHALRTLIYTSRLAMLRALEDDDSPLTIIEASHHEIELLRGQMAQAASAAQPYFISARDLLSTPPAELIPGTYYQRGGFNVLYGPSGSGKTFKAITDAITVAQREPVIAWEGEGRGGLSARVGADLDYNQRGAENLYFSFEPLNLLDNLSVDRFTAHAGRLVDSIGLVVIDTWARALVGGDENSAKDCGLAIANVTRIQRALNTTILIVHHSNRAQTGERGSGALRGAADVMLEMVNDDGLVSVSCSKAKDFAPFQTLRYRFVTFGNSCVLMPENQVATEYTSKLTPQQTKTLEALTLAVFDPNGATARDLIVQTHIPESSMYRVLSTLKDSGLIGRGAKPSTYTLTEQGRARLSDSQDTLKPLSESAPLDSPHSHSPLGVRVESSGEREGDRFTSNAGNGSRPESLLPAHAGLVTVANTGARDS